VQLSRQGAFRTSRHKQGCFCPPRASCRTRKGVPVYTANVGSGGKPERIGINGNFAVSRNDAKPSLPALKSHFDIYDNILSFSEGKQG